MLIVSTFLISGVLLVISLSLKTFLLTLKVSLRAAETAIKKTKSFSNDVGLTSEEAPSAVSNAVGATANAAKKTANAAKKTVNTVKTTGKVAAKTAKTTGKVAVKTAKAAKTTVKLAGKAGKAAIQAIKLLIRAIQALINLIHAVVAFLLSLGVVGIVILIVVVLFLVAAIVGAVAGVYANSSAGGVGGVTGTVGGINPGVVVPGSPSVVQPGDTASLLQACESLGRWYISNVPTYSAPDTTWYTCDLLPVGNSSGVKRVGDSCAYFASAYATMISGQYLCVANAGCWYMSDEEDVSRHTWHSSGTSSTITAKGFAKYTVTEIGGLAGLCPGDIIVSSPTDPLQEGKYGHCEIYLGENTTFGWGSVKSNYPTTHTLLEHEKTDSNGVVHKYVSDGKNGSGQYYHWYGIVYRYVGGS